MWKNVCPFLQNINDIFGTNVHFWNFAITPLLAESRKDGIKLNPARLKAAFDQVSDACTIF